ncbi:ATP-binding protein [Marimonas sp. MJW-29]|uniref:histidine kinase n=1 Tax=Sulfitobacter sediminis TaxID=3234186 RepID=A0ABV3RLA9_9RHOB
MQRSQVILEDLAVAAKDGWDAEPFLRKVTDIAPCVIYVFNHESQSNEYTNRSIAEALGYSGEEIKQMGAEMLPRIIHPEDLSRIVSHFAAILSLRDGAVTQLEYRVRHKNGNWVWLLSNDTVFERDPDGKVIRHIGAAADITAQKSAEENARAEHLIATTTNDELKAFSYAMSHDMKAPSNTLNLLLNELLSVHGKTMEPDAVELCSMALATVSRMGKLVTDVMNYTQVINQDVATQPTDLNAVLADVLENLDNGIRLHGARVTVSDLPCVAADPAQMRILFQNLVENAIHFHKPGRPPRIRIKAIRVPCQKHHKITVQDNCIGIDESRHDQIFHAFKRLNEKPELSGTGLGLAICRRIAANHGCTIELISEKGNGATFAVTLPAV